MKKISVLVPTYNEEENVVPLSKAIIAELDKLAYEYELIYIDNHSRDNTRILLREMCKTNKKIKVIFNAKNFGQFNSPYYGMFQTTGDCTITMCADFQDPVEMIPRFISEWEKGAKIVTGIKVGSKENPILRFMRTCYYKIVKKMSSIEQIEHFTGFGLYDKTFVGILKTLHDPVPFLRGIVAELGYERVDIPYVQQKRRAGKTSNNWYTLYDAAMLSFTSYTKSGLRIATIFGFLLSILTFFVGIFYLLFKLTHWNSFSAGMAPLVIGIFFIGSIQLFFIGFIGEYVMNINTRIMNRPLVIEEERLNF